MVRVLLALSLFCTSASVSAAPARPLSPRQAAALAAPIAKGNAAIDQFRDRIHKRLNALLAQGGPSEAVSLCMTEAPRMASEVGRANGVEIGRTSFRVRNPANAPRFWAAPWVAAAAGKKAGEVEPTVFDLGDRLGMLRPLPMVPACTRCHGSADGFSPEVKAEIARRYPHDRASGFAAGDLGGFFWVEVKKR